MMRKALLSVALCTLVVGVLTPLALGDVLTAVRGGGVQLELPDGWAKVERAAEPVKADPRTLLVAGTKSVRSVETLCQVASYRVPDDGAVVVVIGWREGFLDQTKLELSKLRRGTFACFEGRGAAGQVTRKGRDYQISLMVGDDATQKTIREAFAVARSFALAR